MTWSTWHTVVDMIGIRQVHAYILTSFMMDNITIIDFMMDNITIIHFKNLSHLLHHVCILYITLSIHRCVILCHSIIMATYWLVPCISKCAYISIFVLSEIVCILIYNYNNRSIILQSCSRWAWTFTLINSVPVLPIIITSNIECSTKHVVFLYYPNYVGGGGPYVLEMWCWYFRLMYQ